MKNARYIREQQEKSIYDVSRATGINAPTLARFETDVSRTLRYPSLKLLAEYYGVPIDDLMLPYPEKPKRKTRKTA